MFWSVNDWHVRGNVERHSFDMTVDIHDCPILWLIVPLFSISSIVDVLEFNEDEIFWDNLRLFNVKWSILIDEILLSSFRRLIANAIHLLCSLINVDHESTSWILNITVPVKLNVTLTSSVLMVGLSVYQTARAIIDVFECTVVLTLVS